MASGLHNVSYAPNVHLTRRELRRERGRSAAHSNPLLVRA
jgi:hypothetical protein